MNREQLIHILRNPYGYNANILMKARHVAADHLEKCAMPYEESHQCPHCNEEEKAA